MEKIPYLNRSGTRAKHAQPLRVHLREVVQREHVAGLRRQREILVCLLEVTTDSDTTCNVRLVILFYVQLFHFVNK